MATYVIGMGVSGLLKFDQNYKDEPSGSADFDGLRKATKFWPTPEPDKPSSIDDFWHAAVNGRGRYISAGNPATVADAVKKILEDIGLTNGSGAASASPSPSVSAGPDSGQYATYFSTQVWSGDLRFVGQGIDPATKRPTPEYWSATSVMSSSIGAGCDNRNIYIFRSGAPGNLANFSWNTFRCGANGLPSGSADTGLTAAERTLLTTGVPSLSHYAQMTDGTLGTINQRSLASGSNLINFLRGQRQLEDFKTNTNQLFRRRGGPIGDIVSSAPRYLKGSTTNYIDPGYAAFTGTNANRTAMVYVGSNSGMLHAFFAGESITDPNGGKEAWAFIPSTGLPDLYRLADMNYANNHRFFVDATALPFDVYDSVGMQWRTILVGGLGAGGRGYYALDVTDPLSPRALWEFNHSSTCYDATSAATAAATGGGDCYIGYTYGRPKVGKLSDGTWVVLVTSGLNNVNSPAKPGDGKGYLYVLNAITGKIIHRLATSAGDATTPSGLNQIAAYADDPEVNAAIRQVYGVDLLGNIWRFDINDREGLGATGRDVVLLGTAKDSKGVPQPITTTPILTALNNFPTVTVATGRYLGQSDLDASGATPSAVQVNSIYSFPDRLGTTAPVVATDLRATLAARALVRSGDTVTSTCAGACSTSNGWVIDFPIDPNGGLTERVNVDMVTAQGTLIVLTNLPQGDACNSSGSGAIYAINLADGKPIEPNSPLYHPAPVGIAIQRDDSAASGLVGIGTLADGTQVKIPIPVTPLANQSKRISWRELVQ